MSRLAGDFAGHRRSPSSTLPPQRSIGTAVTCAIDELLNEAAPTATTALGVLERLRRSVQADEALLWVVDGTTARRALHACASSSHSGAEPILDLADRALAIDRLRRKGSLLCRFDGVSGVEDFIPDGMKSFVAAAAIRRDAVSSVLVLAWGNPVPPFDEGSTAQLRIAAALFERAVTAERPTDQLTMAYGIVHSLPDGVAVVDRQGVIVAVNRAWVASASERGIGQGAVGAGMNYLEACRSAAAAGCYAAFATLQGLEAVCNGASDFFQTAYPFHEPGDGRWAIVTVKPLDHPHRGAVVVHSDLTPATTAQLARAFVEKRLRRIGDALPLPIWIASPDGLVTYANHPWLQAAERGAATGLGQWTDVFHADDRACAAAAFREAVQRHEGFTLELRLQGSDGTDRWFACLGTPLLAADGTLESYVGVCVDLSERQRAEMALDEIATRLLAAQEAERSRIARDLHDDLGQQIVLLDAALELAIRDRRPRGHAQPVLLATRLKLQEIASSIHNLAHTLHPAKLRLLGLVQTLHSLCRDVAHEAGQEVRFEAVNVPQDIDEDIVLSIYRVAQEALQNAVKHSGARTISVHLLGEGGRVMLRVVDNGGGFDPTVSQSSGLGLLTMRERVELIGGTLTVTTAPMGGTTIEASVDGKRRAAAALT